MGNQPTQCFVRQISKNYYSGWRTPTHLRVGQLVVGSRVASVGILGKEREPGVGKLAGWHGNFYTGFEKNT